MNTSKAPPQASMLRTLGVPGLLGCLASILACAPAKPAARVQAPVAKAPKAKPQAPEKKAPPLVPFPEAPFYEGLTSYSRPITTQSKLAQAYFDQGLMLLQGFNHFAASRAFEAAAKADPNAAMAYAGIALANGPHINRWVMTPEQTQKAYAAIQNAQKAPNASPVEREFIQALATRYGPEHLDLEGRKELNKPYAKAMKELWARYPKDPDIGAFYAEAAMDLRPWDLWDLEGTPHPGTLEIIETLKQVLALSPDHPLALHLYIHAIEASPSPQDAMAAADRLRLLVPGHSHLLHMPSHIDARTGHWNRAVDTNLRAVAADEAQLKAHPEQDFYFLYMFHNRHLLAYAAMMAGRSQEALEHVQKIVDSIPPEWAKEHQRRADGYYAMPAEALMRFGKWEQILALPEWPEPYVLARTLRHYARGVAYAATLEPKLARQELKLMNQEIKRIANDQRFGINRAQNIASIARNVLEGEILYREGKIDQGIAALRKAVAIEDKLAYGEPPSWIQPVRHALGAALLQQKRYAQAEQVYRNDLKHKPNNGWGLWGLARALDLQGKTEESKQAQARFEKAWAKADIELKTTCLCLPGV